MSTNNRRTRANDWPEADPRILGQILAAQNIEFALPDTTRIADFFAAVLVTIPGVRSCRVCLEGVTVQKGDMENEVCKECQALRNKTGEPKEVFTFRAGFKCRLADRPAMQFNEISSLNHHFGFFVFQIGDPEFFAIYSPFIGNLANYLAISLENRLQRDLLKHARDELELKVEERTKDLLATNISLQEEIERRRKTENIRLARLRLLEFANTHTLDEFLTATLDEIEALTGSNISFYHFLEVDQKTLTLQNWSTNTINTICTANDKGSHYDVDQAGVWVDCVRERRPIIHNDYLSLPHRKGMPDGHAPVVREAVVPVFRGDLITAIIGVGNKATDYSERDVEIVSQLADLSWDIAERRRAEEEILKLNQELEKRVADRTKELEKVNKELEAFAYSVSHDLRAPLRHIDGFLKLLQKRTTVVLDLKSQHYIAVIVESAKHMEDLIDDLLSFSRMSRSEISKVEFDLNELLQDVIKEYKPEAETRNILWQISPLPRITGDRALLRMVLSNLISNALKFTRSRAQAEINIGWMPGEEEEVIVFVRDNGVGFDMQYADKLFGVFQRLHRADEFEGTGIGLANVRRIISRHGGKTWAEGEVDHGATFYFTLPQPHPGIPSL